MVKRKKKGIFDEFIERFFGDIDDFMPEALLSGGSGAAGYSMEVHTTPEGTEVRVKVYGNVDKKALKEQLERMYPGAKIIIEGEGVEREEPLIRRIDEEEEVIKEKKEEGKDRVSIVFRGGKPIIERSSGSDIKVISVEKIDEEENKEGSDEGGIVRIEFKDGKPVVKKLKK